MRSVAPEEGALLDVTQRLARQIEQQLAALRRLRERAHVDGAADDAGLGDVEHLAQRMARAAERLRMLCGAGPDGADPRAVGEVLDRAAASSAEPVRVTVRPAPIATVGARAAAELVHVLAELLDGALAESALGVTVGGRLGPAGLTVDITVDGPPRVDAPPAGGVADALARRSASAVQVHRSGPEGPYAIVLCPAASLTVPIQRRVEAARAPARQEIGHDPAPRRARTDPETAAPLPAGLDPRDPLGVEPRGTDPLGVDPLGVDPLGVDPLHAGRSGADPLVRARAPLGGDMFGVRSTGSAGGAALFGPAPTGAGWSGSAADLAHVAARGDGARPAARNGSAGPRPAVPPDLLAGMADPLFGPLPAPARTDEGIATPIFEAVASAWFREDDGQGPVASWDSPGDAEWRAAAARAARSEAARSQDAADATTASGLPRRRPGRQMVTPPLQRAGAAATAPARAEERAPERVRERLDGYQRGLRQGRHRAVEPEAPGSRVTRWA
ncbi:MAG: hypothetical protein ACT4RN_21330 [Pseudonocardia sp.]